ncbi:MAG: hypothetical protein A2653_00810 [Candidatus Zambryskibacteria bacterium RIFCSPHIGHO2_01_FULL_43_25]|uniref:Uncharacterized protein n=1 Tax=Candidatus Zambryskibacteria bacterium RIFCSPLOWO2_01_FULL_45_21 TaxID=1802761 RepID=A0A1G2U4M0_9BACT|nr:MAG: hypothetical protein A2653_00810 [Candidatus Zambryskibacteria bacterium RIFCSPHIGHO2_01_FULL_43_25]OHB00629.1 MAG: hypothetical protein A3E94_03290 [Candidatus Zambryskibacteria bacterium RIFCSPHIGHO2_12_FULL_44_12b]OHB04444.1 MAG: hypothetical protein A3B14_03335 [Candidatus Zambryskibacteria bacterium RIFCSPLOWO2_01_FULL_45_21]
MKKWLTGFVITSFVVVVGVFNPVSVYADHTTEHSVKTIENELIKAQSQLVLVLEDTVDLLKSEITKTIEAKIRTLQMQVIGLLHEQISTIRGEISQL